MLADLPTLKTFLRIPDAGQDALLTQFLIEADTICKAWTKQILEFNSQTEYTSGTGTNQDIWTKQKPVWKAGLQVWLDPGGFGGDGVGAFPQTSLLTIGTDFVLMNDYANGAASKRGTLRRLGGGIAGTTISWPWDWRSGTLTARLPPAWPGGWQNIKMQYTSGYGQGAPLTFDDSTGTILTGKLPQGANNQLPRDLIQACVKLAAWIRQKTPVGTPLGMDKPMNAVVDMLNSRSAGGDPELATVRQILSRYREFAI